MHVSVRKRLRMCVHVFVCVRDRRWGYKLGIWALCFVSKSEADKRS